MSYGSYYEEPDPGLNDPFGYEEEETEEPDFVDVFPPVAEGGITLEEALELAEAATPAGFMTGEEYDGYLDWKGERDAEMAWLREAESRGWMEDHMESLYESGLRARWY